MVLSDVAKKFIIFFKPVARCLIMVDLLPRHSIQAFQGCKDSPFEDVRDEDTMVCRECEIRRKRWFRYSVAIPWLVSMILLILSVALGISSIRSGICRPVSYWAPTELETLKNEIPATTKRVRFTAGLVYNEDRELVRTHHPDQPEFVGTPTPELDAAWKDLMGAANVFVTAEEERQLGGGLYLDPDTNLYMAGPTVFHDLHCLNMIRQSLPYSWDYYPHNNRSTLEPHLDHCIDNLRMSLMCTGDMTLAPIVWDRNKGRFILDFEVEHTCRDYDALKRWSLARDSEHNNRWPENAARLHAEGH